MSSRVLKTTPVRMEPTKPSQTSGLPLEAASELEYLLRLLHWSGTMRHPRAGVWSTRSFYMRHAIVVLAILLFLCSQGLVIWREGAADIDRFTLAVSTFNTIMTWLFRLWHIAFHEQHFHYLASQVDRDFMAFMESEDVSVLESRGCAMRRFVMVYLWYGVAGCSWWLVFPMVRFGFCAQGVPFIITIPYDVTRPHLFIPTWVFCCFISLHVVIITMVFDSFNVSLMVQMRLQLAVLGKNLIKLTQLSERKSDKALNTADILSNRFIHRKLRKYILHHQVIIRNCELLENCLGGMLLGQSLSIGAAVCFQLFQIAMSAESLAEAGKFACYLSVMAAQLFVYCWFGDDLISESENVCLAAYSCATSLQGCPTSLKRSLLLIMTRAQRPLCVTAAGLFPLSRESFVAVVNMSYSFFAILRNFKDN